MNNEKNEFNVLLRQFMDETHARQALQDFDAADRLLEIFDRGGGAGLPRVASLP